MSYAQFRVSFIDDVDAVALRLEIDAVDCAGPVAGSSSFLGAWLLVPGSAHSDSGVWTTNAESEHQVSQILVTLNPGCYRVIARPLRGDHSPSEDCVASLPHNFEIAAGSIRTVELISQCPSLGAGGLQAKILGNRAPSIELEPGPTSVDPCAALELCVSGGDPDGDPLQFEWDVPPPLDFQLLGTNFEGGLWSSCGELSSPQPGSFVVAVHAFDLLSDGRRFDEIEEIGAPSRASFAVPIEITDEPDCGDEGDDEGDDGRGDD